MRIPCPYCGERDHGEFAYRGDAMPTRPRVADNGAYDQSLFADYVYLRDNPAGWLSEFWQHTGGCRAWLVVERHVASHEVARAVAARGWQAAAGRAAR